MEPGNNLIQKQKGCVFTPSSTPTPAPITPAVSLLLYLIVIWGCKRLFWGIHQKTAPDVLTHGISTSSYGRGEVHLGHDEDKAVAMPLYYAGMLVLYMHAVCGLMPADIVKVDLDECLFPYYTIQLEGI